MKKSTLVSLAVLALTAFLVFPATAADVGNYIPVQGKLTDAAGNPLDGDFTIAFRLYAVLSGGTELCLDTNLVKVTKGLFNSQIWGNCQDQMNGQQLYLGIEVAGNGEMTPRQPIYAVPYAWSLRPNASIIGSVGPGAILHIENSDPSGRGVRSYAMSTTGTNYGIVGASKSPDGFGGYFYNTAGGTAIYADNDVRQNRAAGGLVKAAALVTCGTVSSITRSFNTVNTTPITIAPGASNGNCTLDFGFDVSDRFVVATATNSGNARIVTYDPGATVNKLDFYRYDISGNGANGLIMVLIY